MAQAVVHGFAFTFYSFIQRNEELKNRLAGQESLLIDSKIKLYRLRK